MAGTAAPVKGVVIGFAAGVATVIGVSTGSGAVTEKRTGAVTGVAGNEKGGTVAGIDMLLRENAATRVDGDATEVMELVD